MSQNTIRDILPPEHRRGRLSPQQPSRHAEQAGGDGPSGPPPRPRPTMRLSDREGRFNWKFVVGIVVLILVFVFVAFSLLFSGAELTVVPKTQNLVANGSFTAHLNPPFGGLSYQIMTLERTQSELVPATGKTFVEEKASGNIIVFNDFNSLDQRLIRNTRFESPEGLIYRIDESIVVPGQDEDGNPGQIEVTVYADESGEAYNIGLTDFTIPGFKGSSQFEHFFAQSKTPMTGGFVGERLSVEDSVLAQTKAELQRSLRETLIQEVTSQIPGGFVLFDGGIFVDFISAPITQEGDEARVAEEAVLYAFIFNERELAEFLATNTIAGFEGGPVEFQSTENLVLTSDPEVSLPWEQESFTFTLNGSTNLVWAIDAERLIEDLRGRNKDAIHTILSGYPSIERAEAVIRPFWKGSFPAQAEDIKITEEIDRD